ncbi:CCA tRNA nucleotidyltransferase [Candidatus Bipolaricaulota bacterium]|nr:CCA tRNA nucleotidyltransferase [Candidatus Bipolaricaulota bacterium]
MRVCLPRLLADHPLAAEILHRLREAGHTAVLVGGVVRDAVLAELRGEKFAAQDVDIATSASPAEVRRLFPDHRVLTVGESFGVVVVVAPDGRSYEVASFRTEQGYRDGRRPDAVRWGTLDEDVQRRDFTVNGLVATVDGEVLDRVGGIPDLTAGLVRAIGDPGTRFGEDCLRMLRAVRFACQLGFAIEEKTAAAIRDHAPRITSVSWERIRDELVRILATPRSGEGVLLLDRLGLLVPILPEVAALHGVPQPEAYHPEGDVFVHTVAAVRVADLLWDDPRLKLAVLLHDVGKPAALARSGGENMGGHCGLGAEIVSRALLRLRFPKRDVEWVAHLVREHMRVARLPEMGLGKQVCLLGTGEDEAAPLDELPHRFPLFADLLRLVVCDAEASAHRARAWAPLLGRAVGLLVHLRRIHGIRRARSLLTGDDLLALGFSPGPRLGEVLELVQERILSGEIATREEALDHAARLARGHR